MFFSVFWFSIYSFVRSVFWSSSILFIRSSGFGLTVHLLLKGQVQMGMGTIAQLVNRRTGYREFDSSNLDIFFVGFPPKVTHGYTWIPTKWWNLFVVITLIQQLHLSLKYPNIGPLKYINAVLQQLGNSILTFNKKLVFLDNWSKKIFTLRKSRTHKPNKIWLCKNIAHLIRNQKFESYIQTSNDNINLSKT